MRSTIIRERINSDVSYLLQKGATDNSSDLWSSRATKSLEHFISPDKTVNFEAIENFRRDQVYIIEMPVYGTSFLDTISGARRAGRVDMRKRFEIMREHGALPLLKKYPLQMAGNPHAMELEGYSFNKRWSHSLRYLGLSKEYLSAPLSKDSDNMTVLDIGGAYGVYLWLMKQEFKNIKAVLVEFPEQLILAYYFWASSHEGAKINTLEEAYEAEVIDREFIERYDYTLVPIDCYSKLTGGAADLITNFFSLGEMNEEWFDTYKNSDVFRNAKYLFTINRFFSKPTYGTDIDILSYPLNDYKKLFFNISPYDHYHYRGKWKILTEKVEYTSQFFEFIGERQ
jgi:putative sugar O-methyltransferase